MVESRNDRQALVLFRVDDLRCAVFLTVVERVIRAVAVTPVPEMPPFVLGVVNMTGQLLPVFSLRRCLGLPDRPIRPEDQFVIVRTSRLALALMVDEVQGLNVVSAAQTASLEEALTGGACHRHGLVKIDGDIVVIYDLETLIRPEDEDRLLQMQTPSEG